MPLAAHSPTQLAATGRRRRRRFRRVAQRVGGCRQLLSAAAEGGVRKGHFLPAGCSSSVGFSTGAAGSALGQQGARRRAPAVRASAPLAHHPQPGGRQAPPHHLSSAAAARRCSTSRCSVCTSVWRACAGRSRLHRCCMFRSTADTFSTWRDEGGWAAWARVGGKAGQAGRHRRPPAPSTRVHARMKLLPQAASGAMPCASHAMRQPQPCAAQPGAGRERARSHLACPQRWLVHQHSEQLQHISH